MQDLKPSIEMINVVLDGDYQFEQELPLGMAAVGAYIREQGYNVSFKQCFASRGEAQMDITVQSLNGDIYGLQLNITNFIHVQKLAAKIKAVQPQAIIVLGGPFLTSLSEKILENEPLFDYIVVGEGEITFLALIKAIQNQDNHFEAIEGLVWRDSSGMIRKNKFRKLIEDIDLLPFPARDFFEQARRDPRDQGLFESVRMISSRGCVGRCSFCCVNAYNKVQEGKRWRGRSPKKVVDEIEYLYRNFGAKIFNFSDSSFEDPGHIGKQRSKEICEEIIRRGLPFSAKIYMRCETMKTKEDIDLLKLYKKAGIDVIIIGVESGSDYELDLYEKAADLEDNYRVATILKELDLFYVHLGFIMFGPNSNFNTLRSNIEFLYKNGFADSINPIANVLSLFRDSKLFQLLKAEGRVIEPENFWELPRYQMKDKNAERAANNWQNVLGKYPAAFEVFKVQVELANVISRMTNPMNARILDEMYQDYLELKKKQQSLSVEMGELNYNYFNQVLELIDRNCSDEELAFSRDNIFGKIYPKYLENYQSIYNLFLDKVENRGFGLSGLVFRHFSAALVFEDKKRL